MTTCRVVATTCRLVETIRRLVVTTYGHNKQLSDVTSCQKVFCCCVVLRMVCDDKSICRVNKSTCYVNKSTCIARC